MLRLNKTLSKALKLLRSLIGVQIIGIGILLTSYHQYGAAIYGEYSSWFALASFISIICTLRLDIPISLIIQLNEREKLKSYVLKISIISSFILVCIIILLKFLLQVQIFDGLTVFKVILAGAAGLLMAVINIQANFYVGGGNFDKYGKLRLFLNLSHLVLVMIGTLLPRNGNSLILYHSLALLFVAIFFCLDGLKFFDKRTQENVDNPIYLHRRFILFSLPGDGVSYFNTYILFNLLESNFGVGFVGKIALTLRIIGLPIALFGKAFLEVAKNTSAHALESNTKQLIVFWNLFKQLSVISLTLSLILIFFPYELLNKFIPSNWVFLKTFLPSFALLFFFKFIASPLSFCYYSLNYQGIDLLWQSGLMVIIFYVSRISKTETSLLYNYDLIVGLYYLIYIFISFTICTLYDRNIRHTNR